MSGEVTAHLALISWHPWRSPNEARAVCDQCGWTGPLRIGPDASSRASRDADDHTDDTTKEVESK